MSSEPVEMPEGGEAAAEAEAQVKRPPVSARKVLAGVFRFAGSAKAGVVLMGILGAALIVATFREKMTDTPTVLKTFYHAVWFRILLGVIGLNIVVAILRRLPFKRRDIGFVVLHCGLLAILAGGLVTVVWSVEGKVVLNDGGKTGEMLLEAREFYASDESGAASVTVPEDGGEGPFEAGHVLATLPSGKRFVFLKYFPNCRAVGVFVNDAALARNPALTVSFIAEEEGKTKPLGHEIFAVNNPLEPHGAHLLSKDFDFFLEKADTEEDVARILEDTGAGPMRLTILFANDPRIYSFPVEENIGKEIKIPGKDDVTLEMLEYMPNAKRTEEGYVNDATAPANPAVKLRFVDSKGRKQEETVVASEAALLQAAEKGEPWDASGVVFSGKERRRRFVVVQGPDEKLHYRYDKSDGATETGEVEMDKAYGLGFDNLSLKFSEYRPHGKMEVHFEPAPSSLRGEDTPCMTVRVESAAGERETLVPFLRIGSVAFPDGSKAEVRYRWRHYMLPFTVEAAQSRAITEAGGRNMIGWESEVVVRENATGRVFRKTVRVNEPLVVSGYKILQDTPANLAGTGKSQFAVSYDPGVNVIYGGCAALVAGLIMVFYVRAFRKEERACGK